jgi:hypothetical protein
MVWGMASQHSSLLRRSFRPWRSAAALIALAPALIAGLLCSPAFAEAAAPNCALYASQTGNDSNPGTAAAPFATAKRLIGALGAGQTGCLTSGQTFAGFTLHGGDSHGAEGAPVTIASTNPAIPATINTRIVTEAGADWLTFTHLAIVSDALSSNEDPSPTINSTHTSWTYDDISGGDLNICVLPSQPSPWGAAEYTLVEHDRIHDCGRPVTKAEVEAQGNDIYEGRLNGWHAHGIYDDGFHTTVRNSYFYNNSAKGILLRGGSYATIEHNVIDHNGSGVLFGDLGAAHDAVAWNIVTNSTSPCSRETTLCDAFGLWSYCPQASSCVEDSFTDNDVFGNEDGNIAPSYDLCSCIEVKRNVEKDPLYVNAAGNDYRLRVGSPAVGYGPDTAQPVGAHIANVESAAPSSHVHGAEQRAKHGSSSRTTHSEGGKGAAAHGGTGSASHSTRAHSRHHARTHRRKHRHSAHRRHRRHHTRSH